MPRLYAPFCSRPSFPVNERTLRPNRDPHALSIRFIPLKYLIHTPDALVGDTDLTQFVDFVDGEGLVGSFVPNMGIACGVPLSAGKNPCSFEFVAMWASDVSMLWRDGAPSMLSSGLPCVV